MKRENCQTNNSGKEISEKILFWTGTVGTWTDPRKNNLNKCNLGKGKCEKRQFGTIIIWKGAKLERTNLKIDNPEKGNLKKDNPEKNKSEKGQSWKGKIRKRTVLGRQNLKNVNSGKGKSEKGQFEER